VNPAQHRTRSLVSFFLHTFIAIFAIGTCSIAHAADPLASWNEGPAKKSIMEFVAAATDKNGKDCVAPAERYRQQARLVASVAFLNKSCDESLRRDAIDEALASDAAPSS
jgi:hypothetical protein